MLNAKLIEFVRELNLKVAEVVAKYELEVLEDYRKVGGIIPKDELDVMIENKQQFSGLIRLLQSAHAEMRANSVDSTQPVPRNAAWLANGVAKAAKAMTLPETEESKARLAICESCDQWTGKSCKICGCFVKLKVKIPEEKCPAGKW